MVTRTQRHVVGAHYGLRDWIAQRITAVVMILYTLVALFALAWQGGFDHAGWKALWAHGAFRLATFLFAIALLWHAWVGVRNLTMHDIKPVGVRLVVQGAVICALVFYTGWTIQVLWGVRA